MCDVVGLYEIKTSQETQSFSTINNIEIAGNDDEGDRILFKLNIGIDIASDIIDELPTIFPQKPEYLKDLRLDDTADSSCVCNKWSLPRYKNWDLTDNEECGWAYNSKIEDEINGVIYNIDQPYLTEVELGSVKEFLMFSDRHVHHQHVNGFQIQQDIDDGYMSFSGDYRDTFGIGSTQNWIQRTYHADYVGDVMVHCHNLDHEDNGMMAKYLIQHSDDHTCLIPS